MNPPPALTGVSFNWYDFVVLVTLLLGLWGGIRTGFFGEIVRVIGLALMATLALMFYQRGGAWVHAQTKMAIELANLVAFISIAVVVYAVTLVVRALIHRKMKKAAGRAFIENAGGAVLGVARMTVVMGCLTIGLTLMRSPFWHKQVAHESRFGAYVVGRFPSVAAMTHSNFTETLWFLEELHRPAEPSIEHVTQSQ